MAKLVGAVKGPHSGDEESNVRIRNEYNVPSALMFFFFTSFSVNDLDRDVQSPSPVCIWSSYLLPEGPLGH
jgi:hypothetical protein